MRRLIRVAEIDDSQRGGRGAEPIYADNGCDIVTDLLGHESRCLECPLPECVEDSNISKGGGREALWLRHEGMRRCHREGWATYRIALEFGVSQRTVERVVAMKEVKVGVC